MFLPITSMAAPSTLSFSSRVVPEPTRLFLTSTFSHLSIAKLPKTTPIRMGGGPRTFPGGVSKWQWKRMQQKKAKQLLRARLARERQIYEMRKRAELNAAVSELERPWELVEKAPKLLSTSADEQLKVLADRFQKPGGFDLWSEKDGPQLFESVEGVVSSRFFPKGVVHSVKPYGRITDGYSDSDSESGLVQNSRKVENKGERRRMGVAHQVFDESPEPELGFIQRNGHDGNRRITNGKFKKNDGLNSKVYDTSMQDDVNTRNANGNFKKNGGLNQRGNGRKKDSGLTSKVFDMSLQDDGSYGVSKKELEMKKMRRRTERK